MSVPGPPAALWALSVVLWAAAAAVLGEAIRGTLVRWLPLWRSPEPLERFLLDLYVGGAAMYLLAAVEIGAFVAPIVELLPVAGGVVVLVRVARARRDGRAGPLLAEAADGLLHRWAGLAIVSAVGLFAVELATAMPAATGNTYDSSLFTTYVALLLQHGSVPLSFHPYGEAALLYPQGSTVWFAWAQQSFGLPPARTTLLVTPFFLGLMPLSGYVLGRRLVGSARVGAVFAISLAFLGPSTRAMVGGSNDFVLAAPLLLLLVAWSNQWWTAALPTVRDAVGFGLLLGYAGALNVVGTEWLLPALLLAGLFAAPRFAGRALAWIGRWAVAGATALLAGIPSIYVLVAARAAPASLAGALTPTRGAAPGFDSPQFIADVDPLLFRGIDVALSPVPIVRLGLAILLVLGAAALLLLAGRPSPPARWVRFGRWTLAAAVTLVAWIVLLCLPRTADSPLRLLPYLSNAQEMSIWLFLFFGLVATVPLALAFEAFPGGAPRAGAAPDGTLRRLAPIAVALVVIVPAVVLTPAGLGPVLHATYQQFGDVSSADFALLAWAQSHFAPGTRVVVAPGSAAEFLPGYARGIVLLYPMAPGLPSVNASYSRVVAELTNGTLDASGRSALASLRPDVIVVTGNNTVLWPAFWSYPLVAAENGSAPLFPVLWHEGDAWVFDGSGCRPHSAGCP